MLKNRYILLAIMFFSGLAIVLLTQDAKKKDAAREAEALGPNSAQSQQIPERIVTMTPNLTEIVYALGLGERVVGVSQFTDYPPAAKEKPMVGGFEPDLEGIIGLKPDLVVMYEIEQHRRLIPHFVAIGAKVVIEKVETLEDIFRAIETVAQAANVPERGEELVSDIEGAINALASRFAGAKRLKVLWVVQREPMLVAGQDTYLSQLLEILGAQNAMSQTLAQYPSIGAEQVISMNPDVIIEPGVAGGDTGKQREAAISFWEKRFGSLEAVRDGRIYVIGSNVVSIPGPRVVEALGRIAGVLYPEIPGESGQ